MSASLSTRKFWETAAGVIFRVLAKTARDSGVNATTLYTWITKYHQAESPTNKGSGEKHPYDELKRLRRENVQLKEERDILKKAAAYFAKNSR